MSDWQKWTIDALRYAGVSQAQIARDLERELGISFGKSKINKVVKGERELSPDEVMAISKITGFPLPEAGAANQEATIERAPVVGIVSAGYWFENDMDINQEAQTDIPYVPGKYTGLRQFAYRVQGPSMNADRIFDGDYVICVPYWEARAKLTGGDTVVVLRTRGQLKEMTCKHLVQSRSGFELWPKSSDHRHQTPVRMTECGEADDDTEVEVVGLVVGVFSPR